MLVEFATTLDADRLRRGDLDVVDVFAIPDRLENRVCESQYEQILDRFFAEIVVDAVDLLLAKYGVNNRV